MAKRVVKKKTAQKINPKAPAAWLASKLGGKGAKDFLAGLRQATKDRAAGKEPKVEVEGQVICSSYCSSQCYPGTPLNNGNWSIWFANTP
jgi:hypothetical protein